jgi:hypothetical protein
MYSWRTSTGRASLEVAQMVLDAHHSFVEAIQLDETEVRVPQSVVDLFEADVGR